jgi:hypothetical protein
MKHPRILMTGLALITASSISFAYPNMEQSADSVGTKDMSDQIPPYRGGMVQAEELGPLTMYDPNLEDSTMLEEQMDPNPTLNEGEQILEAY